LRRAPWALPSGLPPSPGASYADSGRALPCTRAFAAGTKGSALWTPAGAYAPDPKLLRSFLPLRRGRGLSHDKIYQGGFRPKGEIPL